MSTGEIAEIGKYRILGQIGEGAMGVVYRALDPVLNRPVAIKVMSDALARDADLRGRFLREAQSAGSLQHPNVITIYDFGEVDGHPFIAMEFVEGADLSEILRNNSPLSLVERIDVLIDVLNGLAYAHKRGIVHRDIKPANIRIDEEGRARVMDFGIAHLNSSSMTRTGMMVGTPAYMSPEQITGGAISASTDIFAAGAVMYEVFSGTQAFHGETLQSVMYKIVSAPTPELRMAAGALTSEQNASVAKALDGIVARALAKEPSQRFDNALDMAQALSDVRARVLVGHESAESASLRASVARVMSETSESRTRRTQRRRTIGISVGAVVLVAAAATALALRGRGAPPSVPVAATQPTAEMAGAPAAENPKAPDAAPSPVTPPASRPAARGTAPVPSAPSARELGLFRELQSTALEARRRAVEAGASAAQLDSGDGHNKMANALVLQGKTTEAGDHLNQAAVLWGNAERGARVARAPTTSPRTTAVEAPKPQAAPPPAVAVAATPPTLQPQPVQQAPTVSTSNPTVDVNAVVATYARALESRDVATVRRAYPGITSAQAKGWDQFFSTLRLLHVSLAVSGLDINGSTADAKVDGTYDYISSDGKAAKQPVSFQASFRREGTAWLLVSVH